MSMLVAPSTNLKPSGVPHVRQKGRSAIGEERYQSGTVSQTSLSSWTLTKAIDAPPVAWRHILQ